MGTEQLITKWKVNQDRNLGKNENILEWNKNDNTVYANLGEKWRSS